MYRVNLIIINFPYASRRQHQTCHTGTILARPGRRLGAVHGPQVLHLLSAIFTEDLLPPVAPDRVRHLRATNPTRALPLLVSEALPLLPLLVGMVPALLRRTMWIS